MAIATYLNRRTLSIVVALALLAPSVSLGRDNGTELKDTAEALNADAPDVDHQDPALAEDKVGANDASNQNAPCKRAILTIVVTNNDSKPVDRAAVRVSYTSPQESDKPCKDGQLAPTGPEGKTTFFSTGAGDVRIIVTAHGFDTGKSQVKLQTKPQTITIMLKPTPPPDVDG